METANSNGSGNINVSTTGGSAAAGHSGAPAGNQGGQGQDWTSSLSDDLRGYVQNKGFKDPANILESYRNLEKFHGVPQERLLRLPEKEDDPEWNGIYERLGRPKEAKEYQIKVPEKMGDPKFAEWAKGTFHELGLSKKQAEKLAEKWNGYIGNTLAERDQQYQHDLAQQDKNLQSEWGQAYSQNVEIAKNAAAKFGIDAQTIDKLEQSMGFAGVMKFMHRIGAGLGEHNFVGDNGKAPGVLTPEAARNEISRLMQDSDFAKRLSNDDAEAKQKWDRLHQQAYGG